MAHQRKLIRHAVVALLASAGTAAGDRVSATRVEPHKRSQLPAISVYTLRDVVDREASERTAPRELTREAKVEITGWVAHSDAVPVDDAMDDLAEQIEAAMGANINLEDANGEHPQAADSILEETVMQVLEEDGNDPIIGVVTLTYAVKFRTSPAAPVLDDFRTAEVTHQLEGGVEGVGGTVPAVDEITVQEAP